MPSISRIRLSRFALPALLGGLAIAACSDDNNGGGGTTGLPASQNYVGIYASTSGSTGPVSITFTTAVAAPPIGNHDIAGASSAPNNATGTVGVGGSDVAITGSLDGDALHMTGANNLVIDGTLADGVITGTFTSDAGDGNFSAASDTEGSPARSYCGSFEGTEADDSPQSGSFTLVVAGTVAQGLVYPDGDDVVSTFAGVAVPSAGTFTVNQTNSAGTLKITDGTYDNEGTAGHYATSFEGTPEASGSFSGLIDCPAL